MKNTSHQTIVFRDDAGKHAVKPGATFEVVGDQHIPAAEDAIERAKAEKPEPEKGEKVPEALHG